jgi:RecA/RadA recombinase
MSTDDLTLGDESTNNQKPLSAEELKKQDAIAQEAAAEVLSSVEVTDEDKEVAEVQAQAKMSNEDEQVAQLTADFSSFVTEKIDISNEMGSIDRLPTGIDLLDAISGGGIGVGTFTMIVGNPGTFKSSLLSQIIGHNQQTTENFLATYHDSENGMTTERLAQMGVIKPKLIPYDNVSVESIFKTIEALSAFKTLRKLIDVPSMIGWDSIANTDTEKGIQSDDTDINKTIGLKARILSQLFPRFLGKMKQSNISLVAVNQLREKLDMGQFSAPNDLQHMGNKDVPGGQAVKFNAFHLLFLRSRGDLKFEQYGINGVRLEAFYVKNKFFRPYVPISLLVDFNKGVSNFWTNYNFLVDSKRIKAGPWNTILGYDEKKFRTKDAPELYQTDEKFKTIFDKSVKELIQSEIIGPNTASSV